MTRRDAVRRLGLIVGAIGLAACAPIQPAAPAQPTAAPAKPAEAPKPAEAAKPAAPAAAAQPTTAPAAAAKPTEAAAAKPAEAKPAAAQPKKGGRLTVGMQYDVIHFDPAGVNSTQFEIMDQVFSTLTRLDGDLKPQPELAESWDLSSDRKKIQLKLRPGVTFHSGKELTADDVVATIERYKDEKTAANIRPQILLFKDPKAVNKNTVEISFDDPMGNIFDAFDLMFIWDKDNFNDIRNKPNGTGPFKMAEWQPGNQVRLTRNDKFYKNGLPYLDEIILKVFPDYEAMIIALQSGAVDATSRLRARDKKTLSSDPNIQINQGRPGVTIFTLAINTTKPPFTDKRVRQAISYAMNRQRFVDTFLEGLGEPWCLPWPEHSPAYDAAGRKAQLMDIAKAKSLLAEAGFPNGFETTLMTNRTRAGLQELSEFTRNDLAQVGIQAKIEVLEEAAWSPRYVATNFDITPNTTGRTSKNPASLFALNVNFGAGRNYEKFDNAEYKKHAATAMAASDPAELKAAYAGLNKIILEEAFNPVIAPQTNIWAVRKYVKDFGYSLDDWSMMEATWLDK